MQSWIGLIGVLAGGGIAILGQLVSRRTERRDELITLFFEQSAQLVALSEDYRNRIWKERRLELQGRVSEWDLREYRLAEARLKILCGDSRVIELIGKLNRTGVALGRAWRNPQRSGEEVEAAWQQNKEALDEFIDASRRLMEQGRVKRMRRLG